VSDEEQIRRTLSQFCVYLDERRFREWCEIFTEDAELFSYHGRQEIYDWISNDELARVPDLVRKHTLHNILLEIDGDRATGTADLVMFDKYAGAPWKILTGKYTDEFVRDGDRWLIAKRQLVLTAKSD
jgi:3-phenylpropionate/cinnamic acid dioxygenase small subunit